MPVKVESTPMLPGLSPVGGKTIEARFDAACMSSDGGLLALREVEQRLAIASRLAGCIRDPRDPSRVIHGLDEIIRTRMLMIAAGYEDGNDADHLRRDPMFKFDSFPDAPVQRGGLRDHVAEGEALLLGALVRHVAGGRHVAAVVAGAAVVVELRLVGPRQSDIGVECALARDAACGGKACGGQPLGRPDRAVRDAGGERGVAVVAQQGRALRQPGVGEGRRMVITVPFDTADGG